MMKRGLIRALGILGALFALVSWHRIGASWREAFGLSMAGLHPRPISGGAVTAFYTGARSTAGSELGGGLAPAAAANSNNLSVVARWARQVWIELPRLIYWAKFMDTGMNTIIQLKKDLENQPGDRIKFDFIRKLGAAGTREGGTLEGNEEAMTVHQDEVVLYQKRNAVRLAGRLSERSTAWDQRSSAKELLTTWMAERIDGDLFAAMDLSSSTKLWGGSASALNQLAAGDYMTTALLTRAKGKAKKMGTVSPRQPGAVTSGVAADWKIWPVKVGNKEYYVCIISPEQEHDLKIYDAAWSQAQREAQVRGDENPIFEGSAGVWDQVIIHVHEGIATAADGGVSGTLPVAYAQFLGRQAGAFAWGQRPTWVEKEFEYGDQTGFAIGAIWGSTKAVFNAQDNAMIQIGTHRSNL